ncbi:uncharacterized protein JCM6883_007371 [Sporobolomyces salmoneus]|uniref:uncharacterized protein n=1 Tax=Sporobolomyces salmoneus TaxID=183962 RepID=UPI003177DFCB
MPPQLPVELLRLVVHDYRLPPFSSSLRTQELERGTQSTLCSLCLTSRVFYETAQPLLYNFVRIPRGRTFETLSLLVENSRRNDRLSSVETVVFEKEEEPEQVLSEEAAYLLKEVPFVLSEVKQLVSYSDLWTLDRFVGSNLSGAFLDHVKLDTTKISRRTFPSLAILGLYTVELVPESFQSKVSRLFVT